MPSAQDSQKVRYENKIEMWDHDPDSTNATVVTPDGGTTSRWMHMADFHHFAVAAMSSNLTGAGISKLEIVAADDASGTNTVVIKDSGAVTADAVGDWLIEECSVEEIAQISADNGYSSAYVAGRITVANAADEAAVMYLGYKPRHARDDLTPETTIS